MANTQDTPPIASADTTQEGGAPIAPPSDGQTTLLKALSPFLAANPSTKSRLAENKIVLENVWEDGSIELHISVGDDKAVEALNAVVLPRDFDAFYHSDTKRLEFIFYYLNPASADYRDVIDRRFAFHFKGYEYSCAYEEPSAELMHLARLVQRSPGASRTTLRQLAPFRDFQRLDTMGSTVQEWFKNRVPRSFFVETIEPDQLARFVEVARHLNCLMLYFDRISPRINIYEEDDEHENPAPIGRYVADGFPATFATNGVDEFSLRLLSIATKTEPRFAFLYYYQIFEYAGHYHADDKIKARLRRILQNPAIVCCTDSDIASLTALLSEMNQTDDLKIERVLEERCDPAKLWADVELNRDFFCTRTHFEGGLDIDPLIAAGTTKDAWVVGAWPKLLKVFTRIRNGIAHARERRQEKIVLPSPRNTRLLLNYIPLIRRAAEEVAIRS